MLVEKNVLTLLVSIIYCPSYALTVYISFKWKCGSLSKMNRIVDYYAKRPQVQERV
jgi:GTP cyclohydrolase I